MAKKDNLIPYVEGVECVYDSGDIVWIKERFYCFNCGKRNQASELVKKSSKKKSKKTKVKVKTVKKKLKSRPKPKTKKKPARRPKAKSKRK